MANLKLDQNIFDFNNAYNVNGLEEMADSDNLPVEFDPKTNSLNVHLKAFQIRSVRLTKENSNKRRKVETVQNQAQPEVIDVKTLEDFEQ